MAEKEKLYSGYKSTECGKITFDPSLILSTEKMRNVFSSIDECIHKNELLDKIKKGVLIGFSGGPDSILLLFFFYNLRKQIDFKLKAVHVNHSIRGDEAVRDEVFSRNICAHLSVDFESVTVDIPKIAEEMKCSVELAAREERYKIFRRILSTDKEISYIATAHNSTDNLETVMFNLLRGSGLAGLCGINVCRDEIIRPMLYVSKEDVISALESIGAPFVIDSTNECFDYTRNYIRGELYPLLKKISNNPDKSVLRACSNLLSDASYLDSEANKAYISFSSSGAKASVLADLHPSLQARVLVKIIRNHTDKMPESVHIKAISEQLFKGGDFSISIPGDLSFICEDGVCFVGHKEDDFTFERVVPLKDGINEIEELGIAVVVSDAEIKESYLNVYKFSTNKKINSAIIDGSLILRTKKEGDCYFYGGVRRKLKKLFIDKKIPKSKRSYIPIIADDSGILWIPGFPLRDFSGNLSGTFKWVTVFVKSEDK